MHVKPFTRVRQQRRQRGYFMMEIMAGIVVTGTMLAAAQGLNSVSDAQTSGRNDADSLADFQQLAGQWYSSNRTNYETALGGDPTQTTLLCQVNVAADGTGGTVVANATAHTCTFDATLLRASAGVWPAGKSVNVAGGGRWVAVARQIMSTDPTPVPTGAEEILFVLAAQDTSGNVLTTGATATYSGNVARTGDSLAAGMNALGGTGGYIPPGKDFGNCQYNATTKQACGNGWVVNLANFIN